MSWIKMRTNLTTHPKVVAMSLKLKQPVYAVIGALHYVWSVADAHTENGHLGMSEEVLDATVGCPGISAAMLEVEWLSKDGATLAVPAFDTHNSASAKARAQEASRSASRRATGPVRSETGLFPVENRSVPGPREEKRREEKKRNTEEALNDEVPEILRTQTFADAWSGWIDDRRKRKKPVTERAIKLQLEELAELARKRDVASAIEAINTCIARGWQGLNFGIEAVEKKPFVRPRGVQAPPPNESARLWSQYDALPAPRRAEVIAACASRLSQGTPVSQLAAKFDDAARRTSPWWLDELRKELSGARS